MKSMWRLNKIDLETRTRPRLRWRQKNLTVENSVFKKDSIQECPLVLLEGRVKTLEGLSRPELRMSQNEECGQEED